MDDNLGNEPHRNAGEPGCTGPAFAFDTPIIEMIAKPALPRNGLGGTACKRRAIDIAMRSF